MKWSSPDANPVDMLSFRIACHNISFQESYELYILEQQASALLAQLDPASQHRAPWTRFDAHFRVQYGNHLLRNALRLHLLRGVSRLPSDHRSVRDIVSAIIELASDVPLSGTGMGVGMLWPLIIAGNSLARERQEDREAILRLIGYVKQDLCTAEPKKAIELLEEIWKRMDERDEDVSWTEVMQEQGWDLLIGEQLAFSFRKYPKHNFKSSVCFPKLIYVRFSLDPAATIQPVETVVPFVQVPIILCSTVVSLFLAAKCHDEMILARRVIGE